MTLISRIKVEKMSESLIRIRTIRKYRSNKKGKKESNYFTHIGFLGTGAGGPSRERNSTSHVIKLGNGNLIMVDCGEATQYQIARSFPSTDNPPSNCPISCLLITHMHADHVLGIPSLLSGFVTWPQQKFIIIGPVGIKNFVLHCLEFTLTKIPYTLEFKELIHNIPNEIGIIDGIQISAFPHTSDTMLWLCSRRNSSICKKNCGTW